MKQNTILIVVVALLIGGIGGYLIADKDDYEMGEMDHSMMSGEETNSMPMEEMNHSAMMVSSEREFVEGMIPHHQEAVDTASEVLVRGGSTAEIRTLAIEIVAAQETEITMLKEWYLAWYGEAYVANDSYQSMMRDLSQLSGTALDQRFLEDMIPHHMGAIMMAQSVRPYITHQEVTDMVDAIMQTQSAEIQLMQELLKTL
jgi:uncharacterized protein (DUF305 family)